MSAKRKRFRAESIVARFGARICIRVFAARKENGKCARSFGNAWDRRVRLKNMKTTGRGCSRPVAILNRVRIGQGNGFAPLPFAVLADDRFSRQKRTEGCAPVKFYFASIPCNL